jgi:hypothetical protein
VKKLHLVMMENSKSDFKYFLGVFSTGSKAEAAAEYEIARRRANNLPGICAPKIFKVEVDLMGVPLSVDALEELKNRR